MEGDKILDHFLSHKQLYSGIAILMIVLTHVGIVDNHKIWTVFYPGFLGVDIFMLYSGYCLCYSYSKNSLWNFYKRRAERILPLFLLMVVTVSIIYILTGNHLTIWDWFCNLTTLNYYRIGGFYIEWYLCVIILFYAIFPVLYKLSRNAELHKWGGAFYVRYNSYLSVGFCGL